MDLLISIIINNNNNNNNNNCKLIQKNKNNNNNNANNNLHSLFWNDHEIEQFENEENNFSVWVKMWLPIL